MECENYSVDELKPIPPSEKSLPCFDCSICLDFAKDPVVTLCGHLYCWPCIYKWLSFQTTSTDSGDNPLCPVCKSEISHTAIVPLYGRGKTLSDDEPDGKTRTVVPPRPRAALVTASSPTRQSAYHNSHHTPYGRNDSSLGSFSHGVRTAPMYGSNPNLWMYGEMIYARVFGNSESFHTFPNSYHLAGSSSPRLRRREMQVDKSLNRLTAFLFCCFFLCLLLF